MIWGSVKMNWEDIIKMKCIICGATLEKQPISIKHRKTKGRYKCPECGHTEVF